MPTLFAVFIFRNTALSGEAAGALLSFAYALGFVTMTALATTLVAGGTRERLPTLVITCGVVGVLAGLIVWQFAFLAIVLATINVVGGYMVTDRMLASFKKKEK